MKNLVSICISIQSPSIDILNYSMNVAHVHTQEKNLSGLTHQQLNHTGRDFLKSFKNLLGRYLESSMIVERLGKL